VVVGPRGVGKIATFHASISGNIGFAKAEGQIWVEDIQKAD
jgi:hypothetical protein